MTDTIHIIYDFDTLVSKIFTAMRGDASYEMEEEKSFSGYIKFTVKHLHLGVLGTLEIKKDVEECIASFSDVILVENYNKLVKETEREIAEGASGYEETDLWDMNAMLVEKLNEKLRINIDPKLSEAKERKWQETIDDYKRIIKSLQDADELQKPEMEKSESTIVDVRSERTEALNKLAVLWVKYNQTQRISKHEDTKWFVNEYAKEVGLDYLSVSEFKKHLPKAYKDKIIDKDQKKNRFIPKLGT